MARIQHTGDIGRAPMPSTLSLLRDHLADCRVKIQRIEKETDGIVGRYGVQAEVAVQRLYNTIGYWREQARQAEEAIGMIVREESRWIVLNSRGSQRRSSE